MGDSCYKNDAKSKEVTPTQSNNDRNMIASVLRNSYGLVLRSFKRLDGYDDVNYHVVVARDRHTNPYLDTISAHGYVLRFFNSKDSRQPQRMEAINAVMSHAKQKGISTQTTVTTLQGQSIAFWSSRHAQDQEQKRVVCLRSYLPGVLAREHYWTADMLTQYGVFVAKVTQAMKDFCHPFFMTFNFSWALDNLRSLLPKLKFVDDEQRRHMLLTAIQEISTELKDNKEVKIIGQVHGDIGPDNIVFQGEASFCADLNLWGLIDFHDTHCTTSLSELAVALCHTAQMQATTLASLPEMIARVLSGYKSIIPLDDKDISYVISAIKARFCFLIVNGYAQVVETPDNVVYVQRDLRRNTELLDYFHNTPKETILSFIASKFNTT